MKTRRTTPTAVTKPARHKKTRTTAAETPRVLLQKRNAPSALSLPLPLRKRGPGLKTTIASPTPATTTTATTIAGPVKKSVHLWLSAFLWKRQRRRSRLGHGVLFLQGGGRLSGETSLLVAAANAAQVPVFSVQLQSASRSQMFPRCWKRVKFLRPTLPLPRLSLLQPPRQRLPLQTSSCFVVVVVVVVFAKERGCLGGGCCSVFLRWKKIVWSATAQTFPAPSVAKARVLQRTRTTGAPGATSPKTTPTMTTTTTK